jgi:hypothetical protein
MKNREDLLAWVIAIVFVIIVLIGVLIMIKIHPVWTMTAPHGREQWTARANYRA